MCGIAGTVRIGDRALVERMAEMMVHRGPDGGGTWIGGDVCLAHRRLKILDLSAAANQPMVSDDGKAVLTYNGEVYNFRALRDDLEKQGFRFHTTSDSEVVLNAYRAYGDAFLGRIEGMFAIAIWDDARKRLLLARDRTGVKPLFYHVQRGEQGDGLAFASELKALCLVPGFERRANRRALRSALRYACNLESESMLEGIHKLLPGCFLTWQDGRIEIGAYWTFPEPAADLTDEDAVARELRETLQRVVESQMVSDVPLGSALSGGLDSSGIVALMAATGNRVDTFTVGHGHDDPDLLKARVVADHCKTNHHEIIVEAENVAELLPAVLWHVEEPAGQMEAVQMYVNYREAAKHVRVLLVGEGADECFAGYDRYRLFDPRLPMPMGLRRDLYERVYMYADEPPRTLLGRVLARGAWGPLPPSPMNDPHPRAAMASLGRDGCGTALERALGFDQRTYLHHLALKRADGTGMAHSLEIRVPFLEHAVVELAARIPARMMLKDGTEKHILRRALAPFLPEEIVNRRKRPFQMQMNTGLVEMLDDLCDRLLRPADVKGRGFFDPAKVERLRRKRPGRFSQAIAHKVWGFRVWSLILCELWARTFIDREPRPKPPTLAELCAARG